MSSATRETYEPDTPDVECTKCGSSMNSKSQGPIRAPDHTLVFRVLWTCENAKCGRRIVRTVPARKKAR